MPRRIVKTETGHEYQGKVRGVRYWKEGRGDIVVEVFGDRTMTGDPLATWEMPKIIGLAACIDQAVRQTDFSPLPKTGSEDVCHR